MRSRARRSWRRPARAQPSPLPGGGEEPTTAASPELLELHRVLDHPQLLDHARRFDQLDLLALDEALRKLEAIDAELLRVVELRYFAGLTLEETGEVLGMNAQKTHRAWTFAKGWLRRELGEA